MKRIVVLHIFVTLTTYAQSWEYSDVINEYFGDGDCLTS